MEPEVTQFFRTNLWQKEIKVAKSCQDDTCLSRIMSCEPLWPHATSTEQSPVHVPLVRLVQVPIRHIPVAKSFVRFEVRRFRHSCGSRNPAVFPGFPLTQERWACKSTVAGETLGIKRTQFCAIAIRNVTLPSPKVVIARASSPKQSLTAKIATSLRSSH